MLHAVVIAFAAVSPAPAQVVEEAPPAPKEPAALVLLDRALLRMGGRPAYDGVPYLRFRYDVRDGVVSKSRRKVLWDRRDERVRFEMETKRGALVVLIDLKKKTGFAFENGERIPEADQGEVVNRAYGLVLNDIRWLVLPWLAHDRRAEVRLATPFERDGVQSERIEVKLDGDVYWLHVARETGEIRGWEWKPAAMPADQAPLEFTWEGWKELQGVKWSTERNQVGGIQKIVFADLEAPRTIADTEFEGL